MPVPHATETPHRIDPRPPPRPGSTTPARPPIRFRPARPSDRRQLAWALLLSGAVHLLLLWTLRIPAPRPILRPGEVAMILEAIVTPAPAADGTPEASAGSGESPRAESASAEAPGAARPREVTPEVPPLELPIFLPPSPTGAPGTRTIPPITLLGPLAPLHATPGGVGRRTASMGARRMEIQRAESILFSRLAGLPGAGVPEEPSAGLAEGGGVTVPVPWGGFVPGDRKDRVWREERCAGKDADEADKPGEGEARNSQCD